MDNGGPVVPSRGDRPFSASRPPLLCLPALDFRLSPFSSFAPYLWPFPRLVSPFPSSSRSPPFLFVFRGDRATETDVRAVKNGRRRASGTSQLPRSPQLRLPPSRASPVHETRFIRTQQPPLDGRVPPFCSLSLSCPTLAIDPNPRPFDVTREPSVLSQRAFREPFRRTIAVIVQPSDSERRRVNHERNSHRRTQSEKRWRECSSADFPLATIYALDQSLATCFVESSPFLMLTLRALFQKGFKNVLN